jgi:hypothetical protein
VWDMDTKRLSRMTVDQTDRLDQHFTTRRGEMQVLPTDVNAFTWTRVEDARHLTSAA